MRVRWLIVLAGLLAFAIPAQASAGSFTGIVVAKQPRRGTVLVVRSGGLGLTVRGGLARLAVGDRITVHGTRLADATLRLSGLRVLGHVNRVRMRGTVLRRVRRGTLVAAGRSAILIRPAARTFASVSDHGDLRTGEIADFRIRFDDDDVIEAAPPIPLGQAAVVPIEGSVVSLAPFVVSVEGLPVTITLPGGMSLPKELAAGDRIELTVQVGAGNVFTLSAIDEIEHENAAVRQGEVEVKGFVVSSSASQIVVNSNGRVFTFVAPTGTTLPVLATGSRVEVRGVQNNGTITVERLRAEDDGGRSGDGGHDGGGDGH